MKLPPSVAPRIPESSKGLSVVASLELFTRVTYHSRIYSVTKTERAEFNPGQTWCTEPIPACCPLTSTCTLTHTYTNKNKNSKQAISSEAFPCFWNWVGKAPPAVLGASLLKSGCSKACGE